MEHRRSWNTSFSPFQVRSAAACRADDIAALAKKRCLHCRALTSLSHTPSFTRNFVTHIHIHTYTYIHTYIRTYTYIQSFHILSCFVTHRLSHSTLSHTTVLLSRSFTTSFVFPSFPVPATTFEAHYWKKLTCGVVRSFNYCCFFFVFITPSAITIFIAVAAITSSGRRSTCYPLDGIKERKSSHLIGDDPLLLVALITGKK